MPLSHRARDVFGPRCGYVAWAWALLWLSLLPIRGAPTAVYHERTTNGVAAFSLLTLCPGPLPFVDRLAPLATQSVTLSFRLEWPGASDRAVVYYTTNGSDPDGALGVPLGGTRVASAAYVCRVTNGTAVADIVRVVLPGFPAYTPVRYVLSAWDSTADLVERFATNAAAASIREATIFSFTVGPEAPRLLEEPLRHTGFVGETHVFNVRAAGSIPLVYQWGRDGADLPGQTNASLTLASLRLTDAGFYSVVVTNAGGAITSAPAQLTVRSADAPRYPVPVGGWAYLLEGNAAGNSLSEALDGTWNHFNGLDSWDGLGRGAGNGQPGGVDSTNGWLTLEDAVAVAVSGTDNRRFYFTRDLGLEGGRVTNANTLLNDGVTLTFRARLTPPSDPLLELTNAPNGWVNAGDGKGIFGLRQAGEGGLIISFSLHNATEDTGPGTSFSFGQAGLHMNSSNGNVRTSLVDPGEGGSLNVLPLDPAVFHEFWITIQGNGPEPGTHNVTVYLDGARTGAVFQVTAGLGSDLPFTNYLALGLGSTSQRGAVDVDFFGYAPGVQVPPAFDEPVGWVFQPSNTTRWLGDYAVFQAGVTGTPPYSFQWFRDGVPLAQATNASLTVGPMAATDDGALFTVVVSNPYNAITSTPPARLTLLQPPLILTQPEPVTATNGGPASFSVVVQSGEPARHQWRRNGVDLPGEGSASLVLPVVSPAEAGLYQVLVINRAGAVTSAPAALVVRTLDFGDAPSTYPVTRAADGAFHVLVPGIYLGAAVDFELDGIPSLDAAGDDQSGQPDEDGVRWLTPIRAGQPASLQVVASTNGMLDAWVDWNANGSWTEAGDGILVRQPLQAGTNVLSISVPADAIPGPTFARFRFSTTGGLSAAGPAPDGEVEDYRLAIEPVAALGMLLSTQPNPVALGSNLACVISFGNTGPSAATGVVLTHRLPDGATFVSFTNSSGTCSVQQGQLTCQWASLPARRTVVIRVVTIPGSLGVLTNRASVTANEFDPVLTDNAGVTTTPVLDPPRIASPPQPVTLTNGSTARFAVAATGEPPLQYEWRRGGVAIPGATNATLTLLNASLADEGLYTVRITNLVGTVESDPVRLTVLTPPSILLPPQAATNLAGGTASFSVQAAGTSPLLYQWFFQGTNAVPGGTNALLVLTRVQPAQAGDYHVVVRNAVGASTSVVARLQVVEMDFGDAPDPPYPSSLARDGARHRLQPGLRLGASAGFEPDGGLPEQADDDGVAFLDPVRAGREVRLRVVASGVGRLDAWLDSNRDGSWDGTEERILSSVPLGAGANQLVFQVPPQAVTGRSYALFRFSLAGELSPLGEAPDGEVENYAVDILPVADLAVWVDPAPVPVAVGAPFSLQFQVTNRGPSTAPGMVFSNVLTAPFTFLQAQASQGSCGQTGGVVTCALGSLSAGGRASVTVRVQASQAGLRTVTAGVVSDALESAPADNAVGVPLDVLVPPSITASPASRTVIQGDSLSLVVSADGSRLVYQWRRAGLAVPGATNATLTLSRVSTNDAGVYTVLVSNEVGVAVSSPATLTVLVPPLVVGQPRDVVVSLGRPASFAVEVVGTSPLFFQWQREGVNLPGQTNATLLLPSAQVGDAGFYRVQVSNPAGLALSDPAHLTVIVPPFLSTPVQSGTFFARAEARLEVGAGGTEPLAYQWWLVGAGPLPGRTNATLLFSNAPSAASGAYFVVVTNQGGAITSAVATLTVVEADFGDAPESWGYPTRQAFRGAWHRLLPGVSLGARADYEADGQPDAAAKGDDQQDAPDEDGVTFLNRVLVGQVAELEVMTSTNGFIDAWVDFGADGSWMEASDQVLTSVPVVAGPNRLSFRVPTGAMVTNTFSRFRFSRSGALPFDGPAPDGEVEDYAVRIFPAVDLVLSLTDAPDPAPLGGNILFTQRITNQGPCLATAVWLTNVLSSRARLISVTTSQGACSETTQGVVCALGALPVGAVATVALTAAFDRPGQYETRALVAAAEEDRQFLNNAVTEATTVVVPPVATRNATPLTLVDASADGVGLASPYPSTIVVAGLTGTVQRVQVVLHNLVHPYPGDLDVLLVGPGGQTCVLMSDVGGSLPANDVTFSIEDGADVPFPGSGLLFNRPYRPTNLGASPDIFPAPAPGGIHGSALSVFAGKDPNGPWSLYLVDDSPTDSGLLAGGWEVILTTADPMADVSVAVGAGRDPFGVVSNVVCPLIISNQGPAAVCGVWLTNWIPPGLPFLSATLPGGSCVHQDGILACWLPALAPQASATVQLILQPAAVGVYSNRVTVTGGDVDLVPGNNTAFTELRVLPVNDLRCTVMASTNKLILGTPLTLQVTATNLSPVSATSCVLLSPLPAGVTVVSAQGPQGGCDQAGGRLRCDWGTLAAGASATLNLVVLPTRVGVVTQEFTLASAEIDSNGADNQATTVTMVNVSADLALTLAAPSGPVAATSNQVQLVTVSNQGPSAATEVMLRCELSGRTDSLAFLPSQGSCTITGGNLVCSLGVLEAGQTAWLRLDLSSSQPGYVTNAVRVSTTAFDFDPGNDAAAVVVPVLAPPVILVGPVDSRFFAGTTARLTVSATGAAPLRYQWLREDEPLPGATNALLQLPGFGDAAAGLYRVRVENVVGGVLSSPAWLRVARLPTLSVLPDSRVNEDQVFTLPFTIDDAETPAAALGVGVSSSNTNLVPVSAMRVEGTGTSRQLVLLPATNGYGETLITLTVTDADGGRTSGSFGLIVDAVNDPPTLDPLANLALPPGAGERRVYLTGITGGPPNEPSLGTLTAVSSQPGLIPAPALEYTPGATEAWLTLVPTPGATGVVVVTVTFNDGAPSNHLASRSFTVNLAPSNYPPGILPLAQIVSPEDTSFLVPITLVDVETPPDQLTLAVLCSDTNVIPATGLLLSGTGPVRFLQVTPATNASGSATLSLTVTDGGGLTARRDFRVTILPVNDPPFISGLTNFTVLEDGQSDPQSFMVGDLETQADLLQVTVHSSNPGLLPEARVVLGGTDTLRTLAVAPLPDQFGESLITVIVSDPSGATWQDSVMVSVTPRNDPPTLDPVADVTWDGGPGPQRVLLTGISPGPSNEVQVLTFSVVSSDPGLVPAPSILHTQGQATAGLFLAPAPGVSGRATLTVTVDDGGLTNALVRQSFQILVPPANAPPILGYLPPRSTPINTAVDVPFTVADDSTALDALVLSAQAADAGLLAPGGLQFSGAGGLRILTLMPATNRVGSTLITITARDGGSLTREEVFLFTVSPSNAVPTVLPVANEAMDEDSVLTVAFQVTDADTPVSNLVVTAMSSDPFLVPSSGLAVTGNGTHRSLRIEPATNATGSAVITLEVRDGGLVPSATSFQLTVRPINDPPQLGPLPDVVIDQDSVVGVPIAAWDAETPVSGLVVTAVPADSNLVQTANMQVAGRGDTRILSLAPLPGRSGSSLVTIRVVDASGGSAEGSFTLTVQPAMAPPWITREPVNQAAAIDGTAIFSIDALGASPLSCQWVFEGQPLLKATNFSLVLSNLQLAGAGGYQAVVTNLYGAVTSRVAFLSVLPRSLPPSLSGLPARLDMEEDVPWSVPFTVADPDTPLFRLVLGVTSTNPAVVAVTNVFFDGSGSNRVLTLVPNTNVSGTTLVRVTVSDGSATVTNSLLVIVNPVNDPPTLDPIPDVLVDGFGNPPLQTIPLTGITAGAGNETQPLQVTVSVDNPGLIVSPAATYTGGGTTGTVTFDAVNKASGSAVLTVSVNDGGLSNQVVSRSFTAYYYLSQTPPVISSIPAQVLNEDQIAGPVPFTVGDATTPASNLVLQAFSSNPALLPVGRITFGGGGSNRTVTLQPQPDQFGTASVRVAVLDGGSAFAATTFNVTVNPVNDLPTLTPLPVLSVPTNATTPPQPFQVSDRETPADRLVVTATSSDTNLVPVQGVLLGGYGTHRAVSVTPASNRVGSATITLTVRDAQNGANSNSFLITVVAPDEPPTISAPSLVQWDEDTVSGAVTVTLADDITPPQNLALSVSSSNTALLPSSALQLGGNGANRTLTLTPAPNLCGQSLITLTATDGGGRSSQHRLLAVVRPVNDPPTLAPLAPITLTVSGGPRVVPFTGVGPGGVGEVQPLAVTATSDNPGVMPDPLVTYASPAAGGTLTLLPRSLGAATIFVSVNDGSAVAATVVRTLAVNVIAPPTVSDLADVVTLEDTPTAPLPFTVSDSDDPAENLTVTVSSSDLNLLPLDRITVSGTGAARSLTLDPGPDRCGNCRVTVRVADPDGNHSAKSFLLVVRPVNDPPTLDPLSDLTISEDSGVHAVSLTGIGAGPGGEVQGLTVVAMSSQTNLLPHPTVSYLSPQSTGTLSFQPATNATGTAVVSVVVFDDAGGQGSVTQSFRIAIVGVNDPPFISALPERVTPEDVPVLAGFTVGDLETEASGLLVTAFSSDPALVPEAGLTVLGVGGARALWIQPATNRTGTATLTVVVRDPAGATNTASFLFTVTPVNDAPIVLPPSAQVTLENAPTAPLPFVVLDPDTPLSELTLRAASSNAELLPPEGILLAGAGSNRTIQLFPATNRAGTTLVTLVARDPWGAEFATNFLLAVNPVDQPPTLSEVPDVLMEENTTSTPIAFRIGDRETPGVNLNVSAASSNPALLTAAHLTFGGTGSNRTVRLTPYPNRFGTATITLTVTDGAGLTARRSFNVTVLEIPDPPTIVTNPSGATVDAGSAVELSVVATGTGPLDYQWFQDGLSLPGATNRVLWIPAARTADSGTYRVRVSNSAGTATSAAANLEVQGPLTPPSILSVATNPDGTVWIQFTSSRNTRCRVEFRAEADAGPWSVLTTVTGNGGTLTVVDPAPAASRRFYRVREE